MRRCVPLLGASLSAACRLSAASVLGAGSLLGAASLFGEMAPVTRRGLRSASTWVCCDHALVWVRGGGAGRSAVEASPFRILLAAGAGEAAGVALAKALPPPNRLPNRSQPPPLAASFGCSWLSALAGAVVASPHGGAAAALRSLRGSLASAAGAGSPPWPSPAS